jgi:aspartate/methionine/tyrosine aminotransferase
LLELPLALGATVKRIERGFQNGYKIDIRELRRIARKKTRLIILTDLHNPSGVKIPAETLEDLADLARTLRVYILIDEVYLDFMFAESTPTCARLSKQFISTNSLTKVYGLDGLRCGWILAEEKLVRRLWQVKDFVDANGPFPAETISAQIFGRLPEILGKVRTKVNANFPMVRKFVESHPRLTWVPPDGGVICFPRYRNPSDLGARLKRLVSEFDTLVVPGSFFEARSHFRLGYGIPTKTLRTGLQNLGTVLGE